MEHTKPTVLPMFLYVCFITSFFIIAEETTVIFKGQKGKTPVEMSITGTMYDESNCIVSKWRYTVRNIYSIAHTSNGFYSTKWKNIYITLSSNSIEKLGCNPPLKPNKEYDIAKTTCMNDKGEDQFQLFRDNIGEESELSIVFTETTASYSITTETRVSSSGCSISTILIIIIFIIVIIIIAVIITIIYFSKRHKRQLPRK